MNNFGVIEIASAKTTNAPGWAYVPDTSSSSTSAVAAALLAQQSTTTNRKRGARAAASAGLSHADANARQEAKVRKELELLDRDNFHRDVNISIPSKPSGGSGRLAQSKHTANVRKILQSQKTFANHLDDLEALNGNPLAGGGSGAGAAASGSGSSRRRTGGGEGTATAQKRGATDTPAASSRRTSKAPTPAVAVKSEDVEMRDAGSANTDAGADVAAAAPPVIPRSDFLRLDASHRPPSHPADGDPLLASRVPALPSDAELAALLAAPPLSYAEARAGWSEDDRRRPPRVFCELCGYWGRVRCIKCGVRVCALDCLELHRGGCIARYGL